MNYIILLAFLFVETAIWAVGRGGPVLCSPPMEGYPDNLATEHFYDADGDGIPEFGSRLWQCGGDSFDFYVSIEQTKDAFPERSYDCAPGNKNYWYWFTVYGPDSDGDSHPSVYGDPYEVCSGPSETSLMGHDTQGHGYNSVDCNDSDFEVAYLRVYLDSDGDGAIDSTSGELCTPELVKATPYISTQVKSMLGPRVTLVQRDPVPPVDCAPDNPAIQGGSQFFYDADGDGFGTGPALEICGPILNGFLSEADLPLGYARKDGDCNDNNPELTTVCKMKWNLDPYYNTGKPKILVSHPDYNPGFGKSMEINFYDYLDYEGDDRDSLIFEVECDICREEIPSYGYYRGEIIANTQNEFKFVAGKSSIRVKATSLKHNISAEESIEVQVLTGDAVVYINGIDTLQWDFKDQLSECDDGVMVSGRCNRGATAALDRVRARTEENFLSTVVPSAEYLDYTLAYNNTESFLEDIFKECLPSSVVDHNDGPEANQFGKLWVETVKFGGEAALELFFPSFLPSLRDARNKKLVEISRNYVTKLSDYKNAYEIVQKKILEGYRVTIVSHSQGNYISNHIYKLLRESQLSQFVRQVQVAAPTLFSEDQMNRYVNAKGDTVAEISSSRRTAHETAVCRDERKHNFIGCYIGADDDPERETWRAMQVQINAAIQDTRIKSGN